MKKIDLLLADYGSDHRTRGNLVCHVFGITLILYGLIALCREVGVGLGAITLAEILIAAAVLVDLSLDVRLGLAFLVEAVVLDLLTRLVGDWRVGLAAFVVGWVFQGVGHARFEHNSPAFFRNLLHLLVGPLFLWNELLRLRPVAVPSQAAR